MEQQSRCDEVRARGRNQAVLTALCLIAGVGTGTPALAAPVTHCAHRAERDAPVCALQVSAEVLTPTAAGVPAERPRLSKERLAFDNTPAWRRRLEYIGREGLPFARLKYGQDGEVFIGITRKGMLGVNVRTR